MDRSIETPLFMAESWEKTKKSLWRKKRRKKWKFPTFSVPLFLHIIRSIETPTFYGRKRRKKRIFSPYSFPLFRYQSRNQYGEKAENGYGEIMDLHDIFHNILHKEYWNTGLQMAWSILTWIILISKPEIVSHTMQWYRDAPTKM